MKLITTLSIAAVLTVVSAATSAHSRGGSKLVVMNDSKDAVAVGGEMITASASGDHFGATASYIYASGKRANAGSVVVNGCSCQKDTIVLNKSRGALAIGAANAGSVVINSGYGF